MNRAYKLKIGNAKIQMLLFGLALKNNFTFYYIFDCSKSLSELCEEIYDWENDELKKVFDYSNCDYTNPNILFIENFEFNPDYKIQSWLLGSIKDIEYIIKFLFVYFKFMRKNKIFYTKVLYPVLFIVVFFIVLGIMVLHG